MSLTADFLEFMDDDELVAEFHKAGLYLDGERDRLARRSDFQVALGASRLSAQRSSLHAQQAVLMLEHKQNCNSLAVLMDEIRAQGNAGSLSRSPFPEAGR